MGSSIGFDHGLPVSRRYSDSFPFEGTLHRVDIELAKSRKPESADSSALYNEVAARAGMARQ
jgi:arylsulfatase